MKRIWRWIAVLLLVTLFLGPHTWGPAIAASGLEITGQVIGGGGGEFSAGVYKLQSTIGQPVIGMVNNGQACSGFWCSIWVIFRSFLPIVFR